MAFVHLIWTMFVYGFVMVCPPAEGWWPSATKWWPFGTLGWLNWILGHYVPLLLYDLQAPCLVKLGVKRNILKSFVTFWPPKRQELERWSISAPNFKFKKYHMKNMKSMPHSGSQAPPERKSPPSHGWRDKHTHTWHNEYWPYWLFIWTNEGKIFIYDNLLCLLHDGRKNS